MKVSYGGGPSLAFASRTHSLATPFTHSLESDSIPADLDLLHSLAIAITRRERSNRRDFHLKEA